MHHRNKADAPSGTSLSIAHSLSGLDRLSNNKAPYPSQSPRPDNTIECAVLRGGGIPADLDISFAGENELLKIEHRALDRTLFAQGAIKAAEWLVLGAIRIGKVFEASSRKAFCILLKPVIHTIYGFCK